MALSGNRGLYTTACEASTNRNLIDQWINEGKSSLDISKKLAQLGEKISDKAVGKYKKYREEHINDKLMENPLYQAQISKANDMLVDGVSKIKQVDVMKHIADTIEHCAELIEFAREDDIRVKNVQDLRYVQMSMLETMKLYADMVMKTQAMAKIEEDPTLLRPSISVNVKNVLQDMLGGMSDNDRFNLIDRIRAGTIDNDTGRLPGDNGEN